MSEQIKSTVFRFATLRSPELLTEKEKSGYHVHHPAPTAQGFFANELANPATTQAAQRTALKAKAATFSPLKTTVEVKAAVGATFFDFAVWLAKNGAAVFAQKTIEDAPALPQALTDPQLFVVWDNLFCQLITGEKPQVRQQCMELLIANGYIQAAGQSHQHQLAQARVIIPQVFYGGGAENPLARTGASETPTGNIPIYTGDLKRATAAVIANQKVAAYQNLASGLQKAAKKYTAQNNLAYVAAKATHDGAVKLALIDFYRDKTGEEAEMATMIPGRGADIPAFSFVPLPQMETAFLQANLSTAAFSLAQALALPDTESFAEALEKLAELVQTEIPVLDVIDGNDNRLLVMNNMVFPVGGGILSRMPLYAFYIQPYYHGNDRYSIYCTVSLGNSTAHAVSCAYHAVLDSGISDGQSFIEDTLSNGFTLEFFSPGYFTMPQGQAGFRFHGTIAVSTGINLSFDTMVDIYDGASGIMTVEKQDGDGNLQAPAGYGIKRLGLADYRRVEQSVCCYLPGEVSHIENIMAREYKERSSRRLTRSEDTTTFEMSMEKETQKDSATTERYELQKEIESVVSKDTSAEAHASVSGGGKIRFDIGGSYAFNTSKQDSNRTAVDYSKEVTEKALERVVQKVREERTIKMIEEFEEQHKHGFDNRLGDKHVSGVYRWVDKVYKNQVFNYGKRLMYEFMVPQPAVFHNEAIKLLAASPQATVLEKPVDPRTYGGALQIADHTKIDGNTFPHWNGKYKADVKVAPDANITVTQAFDFSAKELTTPLSGGAKSFKMGIPEGYEAITADLGWSFVFTTEGPGSAYADVRVGSAYHGFISGVTSYYMPNTNPPSASIPITFGTPVRKELAIAVNGRNLGGVIVNITANCQRTNEAYANWQLESFNAIIDAYNEKLDAHNKAMEAATKPQTVAELNPGFYRQIENTVLRKNCISYLVTDAQMGKKYYQGTGTTDVQPVVSDQMDRYAAMVKFIEQAFEWEIMSYRFYPFYWGNRQEWQQNYQKEVSDPLFRSFLQSGMARAIVSIRPGFEEAVMYFMATGQIWNGGQVPAIGDDLYLSIVEELKNPAYAIDETWETRVPTTLTILQAGSIGLVVDEGLPCDCGNDTGIETNGNVLGNQLKSLTNG
jgi:hypothetical protein